MPDVEETASALVAAGYAENRLAVGTPVVLHHTLAAIDPQHPSKFLSDVLFDEGTRAEVYGSLPDDRYGERWYLLRIGEEGDEGRDFYYSPAAESYFEVV
jgi:hypothetical protein